MFLKNQPGEANRQYALKHLWNEQSSVVVAAIEALSSIGLPEDADACLAVAQARMKATEAAYSDTYRNQLNTAYNLFARRLGRPELPVSRDLEPIEFELARKLPVEVATPLVKKIVYMSAEDGIQLLKEALASPSILPSASFNHLIEPPASKKASEPKTVASTPSEEPASSMPWSIIVVLIAAALGLLWLVLKRRS